MLDEFVRPCSSKLQPAGYLHVAADSFRVELMEAHRMIGEVQILQMRRWSHARHFETEVGNCWQDTVLLLAGDIASSLEVAR